MTINVSVHQPTSCELSTAVRHAVHFYKDNTTFTMFCNSPEQAQALRFAFYNSGDVLEHRAFLLGAKS